MTTRTSRDARSLIVVSRDYGELGFATSFLRGQAFASRAAIMLPDNLFASNTTSFLRGPGFASQAATVLPGDLSGDNGASPTIPAFQFRTLRDILDLVNTHKPDLVFLFSGYLLSNQRGVLSPESLDALLRYLRERGCRVITSDPFLGLAPQLTLAQIDTRMLTSGQTLWERWRMRLVLRLQGPRTKVVGVRSLEDVTHLYPTSIPPRGGNVPMVSFFNPNIVRAAAELRAARDALLQADADKLPPRWLFVVSSTDLECQHRLVGRRKFRGKVLRLLWHALAAGRRPTLIAPASILDGLSSKVPDLVELLSSCPLAEFEERLLEAEYVFYWNAFSFSQLSRLANELPVFLFDRGHLARTVKPYYEMARSCHYGAWEPPYLDQTHPFDLRELAELAARQKPAMRMIRERWQSSPTPDQLVDQLMGTGVKPAPA